MTGGSPVLWGIGTTRTFRAHFALIERGVSYETVPIRTRTNSQDREDFRAVSISGKIPVLQIDDLTLSESAAIARYVTTRGLKSKSAIDQTFIDQWAFFMMTELDATALYVLRRHEGLPEIYGEAEAAVVAARAYFYRQINALDDALLDGRKFLLPDSFTELDILLISILDWARILNMLLSDAVQSYAAGIRQRDTYQEAFKVNYKS